MAAPKENLLSLQQLTITERNTYAKQENGVEKRPMLLKADLSTIQSQQHLRVKYLQLRWQELKEQELAAQQYNRELLQQFEKAQDTLRKMVAHNAAMKTIRLEYELYLEESSPRWQQPTEKMQAAQRTRMENSLGLCQKNIKEHVTQSSSDLHLQGRTNTSPQKVTEPHEFNNQNSHSGYNQDGASHFSLLPPTWLIHPQFQTARFPIRAPFHYQGLPHGHPSYLTHPQPSHLHCLASMPSHHQPWSAQDAPGWASLQTVGGTGLHSGSEALWGQLYTEEPPPESRVSQVAREDAETSRALSSKSERGGGSRSSHLSQELDIKPVRLSSGHTESSESGRDSSQVRKKREKRGRSQGISSERVHHSSQESSRTSSAIITASAAVVQSTESDASSEKHSSSQSKRTKRKNRVQVKVSAGMERVEYSCRNQKEASQYTGEESGGQTEECTSKKAGNQSPDETSESSAEESRGTENRAGDEIQKQESSSPEQSSEEEKGEVKDEEDNADEREKSQKDENVEDEEDDDSEKTESSRKEAVQEKKNEEEDDEISANRNTTEDETGAEDEMEEQEKNRMKEEFEKKRQSSFSSEDEEVNENEKDDDKTEEDEESEEEEQMSDKAGEPEESDSDDSIISPQNDRCKRLQVVLEKEVEDEKKGSTTGSSEDDSNDISEADVIENLLAPQEPTNREKDQQAAETPKAICNSVKIFQVEDRSTKTGHQSDSDEFDHFYD